MNFAANVSGLTAMSLTVRLNGTSFDTSNGEGAIFPGIPSSQAFMPVNLNELLQITPAGNTVVEFTWSFPSFVTPPTQVFLGSGCTIIFTRLQ
jgi:hypothetical protein